MNSDDIINLLSIAAAYDRRTIGEADVVAWSAAADIGRWTYEEARLAIQAHYAEDTDWLMPAHITQRIRREYRQPPAFQNEKRGELPAGGAASEETRRAVMEQVRQFTAKRAMPRGDVA